MIDLSGVRVGCAMTGSFCTFKRAFSAWEALRQAGASLLPIMSFNAAGTDTRFYAADDAVRAFEAIAGQPVIRTIAQAEPIGPKKLLDALAIAPCTGNTLAKLANGIADTPVTLAAKHFYFVPMRQDDSAEKPNSIVAAFDLLQETLQFALAGRQIQPILR